MLDVLAAGQALDQEVRHALKPELVPGCSEPVLLNPCHGYVAAAFSVWSGALGLDSRWALLALLFLARYISVGWTM